jgi:hypothetical protein
MKSKFKVGDRVRCYGVIVHDFSMHSLDATILKLEDTGLLWVKFDDGREHRFYPQQCRKLVKKERRRIILKEYDIPTAYLAPTKAVVGKRNPDSPLLKDWVEFVEVRRTKK